VTPPNTPPPGDNQADSIRITPSSLNVDASGVFDVHISLKSGYDPYQIDPASVRVYSAAAHEWNLSGSSLTMKFYRNEMVGLPVADSVLSLIMGNYYSGVAFQAWDYIKVIDNH
jgi:hypothetical protein